MDLLCVAYGARVDQFGALLGELRLSRQWQQQEYDKRQATYDWFALHGILFP
jgi:hypothetical protein